MGNLLFFPDGRTNPDDFMRGVIFLVVVSSVLSVPEVLNMTAIMPITGLLSLLLIYPWVVLWVKRYHDSGKSGWMSVVPILVYLIAFTILILVMFADELRIMVQAIEEGASQNERIELAENLGQENTLPLLVASAALSLGVAYVFNKFIKHDPRENAYGPPGYQT